jgi:outer membrane protein assembly factor BamD (BamD/ComL family)
LTDLRPQEIERALWQARADDLMELGAAARRANDRRAGYVYSVVRSRFPGTDAAADAAFLLARMHFHDASPHMAATWLETYLRERPEGRFAREAAGRLIETYQQTADMARARGAAERYLRRYPRGPHAELARSVLE